MSLHTRRCAQVEPQRWRNGAGFTRELLAWPSAGDWQLRISVADIDADAGFSVFPGVERWFSVVEGALLKRQNGEKFQTMFLDYDLLAKRWIPYGTIYPFAEGLAGVLMVAGALTWLSIPVALFIGTIGAVSVFKAVYIDKRELKCACVGGDSNVPLGFISLTENLMMIAMAVWMLVGHS